jgi:hypothetical protein
VHVVDVPLSEYVRFELVTYTESQEAGEEIRIAERKADPALDYLRRDFWLFDAKTPQPFAALMEYDEQGRYLGAEVTSDPEAIKACVDAADLAVRYSVPLAAYLTHLSHRAGPAREEHAA